MLITPAAPASAEDEDIALNEEGMEIKRQILKSLDESEIDLEASEDPWFSNFHVSKKGPIQFRQTLEFGDDEISLKIYGPVVKKRPGLRFQMEGMKVGDHPVRMEGYGNVKEGGLRFTIRF